MYTIPVYCLYIVYKYLGMTPSGLWYNCSIVIIFYFPCISLFYSFVCSSHLCILSYMNNMIYACSLSWLMELSLLIKNLNLNLIQHLYIFLLVPLLSQPAWASAIFLYPETCTLMEEEVNRMIEVMERQFSACRPTCQCIIDIYVTWKCIIPFAFCVGYNLSALFRNFNAFSSSPCLEYWIAREIHRSLSSLLPSILFSSIEVTERQSMWLAKEYFSNVAENLRF